jgi:hypothetical protein
MARREPTLAELAMNRQVRAASRRDFSVWWQGSVPSAAYWIVLIGAFGAIAGTVVWRILA